MSQSPLRTPSSLSAVGVSVCLTILLVSFEARADAYTDAFARSFALEAAGDAAGAADVLDALCVDFPQDYALFLRLGWLHFSAADYERAEVRYARAAELSATDDQARLGLAWTRLRLGRPDEACEQFRAAAALTPGSARADEGLALACPRTVARPSATALFHLYRQHPTRRLSYGVHVSVPLTVAGHWLVWGGWRFLRTELRKGNGPRSAWPRASNAHDAWLHAGYVGSTWDAVAHAALLFEDDQGAPTGLIAGATLGLNLAGRWTLGGTWSHYAALEAGQVDLAWTVPLTKGLSVRPGGTWQLVDGQSRASGALTFLGRFGRFEGGVGGRYGDEARSVVPDLEVVYAFDDVRRFGAVAWVGVDLGAGFSLRAGWQGERLRTPEPKAIAADLHVVWLGVGWRNP